MAIAEIKRRGLRQENIPRAPNAVKLGGLPGQSHQIEMTLKSTISPQLS